MNFEDFRTHVRIRPHALTDDTLPKEYIGTFEYHAAIMLPHSFPSPDCGMSFEDALQKVTLDCERTLYNHVYGGSYGRLCAMRYALRAGQFAKVDVLISAMLDDMVPANAGHWGMDRGAFSSSYGHHPKDWYKGETK